MTEGTLEQRVEELERKVRELQTRPTIRLRPAKWPRLDANGEPFGGRFDDDALSAGVRDV